MESINHTSPLSGKSVARLALLLLGLVVAVTHVEEAEAESWTSLQGNRTVEARMIGMWNDHVVLLIGSGRRINVPLDSLNAPSRIQARKVAQRLEQQRQSLARELQGAAEAEAAAAPDPLPEPSAAAPYSPPSPNSKPETAITVIQDQLAAGHLVVLYDSMPMKFRGEFDGLVALVMKKLEPSTWNDSMTQLHRLSDLIVTRQNWILSYPQLLQDGVTSGSPNQTGEIFQSLILPVAALVRAALPPEATTPEAITTSGFGEWLRQCDEAMSSYLAPILQRYSSQTYSWSLLSDTGEQTILQATGRFPDSGESSAISVEMKNVDGHWIPASVADGFSQWVQDRTAELEKYEDGTMSVSDWLGGESIGISSLASSSRNDEFMDDNEEDSEEYDDMDSDDFYNDGSSGDGSMAQETPGEFAKPAISKEKLGTIIQFLGSIGGLLGPLEAAPDKSAFHQAVQQSASPIVSAIDMLGG